MQSRAENNHQRAGSSTLPLTTASMNAVEYDGTNINNLIHTIRGKKVIVDCDLANLYHVKTKRLNEQVRRNISRFPEDFMFKLTSREKNKLVANCDQLRGLKHSSSMPKVFTEHGVVMTSSILKTDKAIEVSIHVVRAFIQYRRVLSRGQHFIEDIELLKGNYEIHDQAIRAIIKVVRELIGGNNQHSRTIGFR